MDKSILLATITPPYNKVQRFRVQRFKVGLEVTSEPLNP
jgi:hypothetical protein